MGSKGRRSAAYVAYRAHLQLTRPPCWLASGPWCTGIGLTVEHDPPLSLYPDEHAWRAAGGTYRGACAPCQHHQGMRIANERMGHNVKPLASSNDWTW